MKTILIFIIAVIFLSGCAISRYHESELIFDKKVEKFSKRLWENQ